MEVQIQAVIDNLAEQVAQKSVELAAVRAERDALAAEVVELRQALDACQTSSDESAE